MLSYNARTLTPLRVARRDPALRLHANQKSTQDKNQNQHKAIFRNALYIDEIHKYEGWSREIKQIYDTHPALKVFITGTSILDLLHGEVDLIRRVLSDYLSGMSFREYLELVHHIIVPVY